MVKEELIKRLKSLGWRTGCVAGVAALSFLSEQITSLGLPPFAVALLGLVIAEGTKWLSNNKKMFGRALQFKSRHK